MKFRKEVLPLTLFFLLCSFSIAESQEPSIENLLLKAKTLIAVKKTPLEALPLLESNRETFKGDFRFWMTYGIALEASDKPLEGLDAFLEAEKLQTIPGLNNRISRLKRTLNIPENQEFFFPRELFRIAKKENNEKKKEIAFKGFMHGIDQQPKYLAGDDYGLINAAIQFFKEKAKAGDPEGIYFLGIFYSYSGKLSSAISELKGLTQKFPGFDKIDDAKSRLKALEEMIKLASLESRKTNIATPSQEIAKTATPKILGPKTASGPVKVKLVAPMRDNRPSNEKFLEALKLKEEGKLFKATMLMEDALSGKKASSGNNFILAETFLELSKQKNAPPDSLKNALKMYNKIYRENPRNSEIAQKARDRIVSLAPSLEERGKEIDEHFAKFGFPYER